MRIWFSWKALLRFWVLKYPQILYTNGSCHLYFLRGNSGRGDLYSQSLKIKRLFSTYLQLGWHHIANIMAYDHLVFILAMSVGNSFKDWKKLAILVTAFTVGHSITLALGVMRMVIIPAEVIEFLIPTTILLTALYHLFTGFKQQGKVLYCMVLFFGLIHGLGFSNFLIQTLSQEESIVMPLLGFNVGLEIGQLIILSIFLAISYLITNLVRFPQRDWSNYICGMASGIAMILMINTKFW